MLYQRDDIKQLLPRQLNEQLAATESSATVYAQYTATADRIIFRESGYTEAEITADASLQEDFREPYARIIAKLAVARFTGLAEDVLDRVDKDYRHAIATLGRLQKKDRTDETGMTGTVEITGLIDY